MLLKKITSRNAMSLEQCKLIRQLLENSFSAIALDSLLDSINLSKMEAEEIIEKGNLLTNQFRKAINDFLKENSIIDRRFGSAISEFEVVIPLNYDHDNHMDTFVNRVNEMKTTYYISNEFNSFNFDSIGSRLEAGKIYKIKIFPILEAVNSEDCLIFLRKQNAVLAGINGITFAYDMSNGQLPKWKRLLSFGENESIAQDINCNDKVPFVLQYSDASFKFDFDFFSSKWRYDDCILCIYKEYLDPLFFINRN